jgi:hypothetical protein
MEENNMMKVQLANAGIQQGTGFGATDAHMSALKDFIKMTIEEPSFFAKSRSDQKEMAIATIQKHKNI